MRLKILLLFIFFSVGFGISSSAQIHLKQLPGPPLDTLTITARLIDSVGVIPNCGYFITYETFRYEILRSADPLLVGKRILITTTPCPLEEFGEHYFVQDGIYVLRIKRKVSANPPFATYTFDNSTRKISSVVTPNSLRLSAPQHKTNPIHPIDTLNLMVKVLDSISPGMFHSFEVKGGYMDLFWSEECRLEIIAGGNPEIAHKIISATIHSWNTKLKYPVTKGWIGNVVVYRTRIDFPPFAFYSLEYVCRPGEFFIDSHALHFH